MTTMSLSLPTCLLWRPPTQWYKVSPTPHTPHPQTQPRPEVGVSYQAWEDFQRPPTSQLAVLVHSKLTLQEVSLVEKDLIRCRRMSSIPNQMAGYLEMSTYLCENLHPSVLCPHLSITSTPYQPNTHSYLLKGGFSLLSPPFFWSHSDSPFLPSVCVMSGLFVTVTEPFSSPLPRPQRFLTTSWLLLLFDMTYSPGQEHTDWQEKELRR